MAQLTGSASRALTLARQVLERWPCATSATAALVVALLTQYLLKSDPLAGIPIVGKGGSLARRRYYNSGRARGLYFEGCEKFFTQTNAIFRITTNRETEVVVIDPKYAKELMKLPDDVLSMDAAVTEALQEKYLRTGPSSTGYLPHFIKNGLNPALVQLNPVLAEEIRRAMESELPRSSEWTECPVGTRLLRVIAMASGRVFVGPDLCRNEKYLDAAVNYTIDVMIAVRILQPLHPWLRPLAARVLPPIRRVQQRCQAVKDFVVPVVSARRKAMAEDPNYQPPNDLLQWMDNDLASVMGEPPSMDELAKYQLTLVFAANHNTNIHLTNMIYNLATMPDVADMLRKDVNEALTESDGLFTSSALQNMKKLDSFLRETMRFYTQSSGSFMRRVLKPFQLSNGQVIPAGVVLELPQCVIDKDSQYYTDPYEFDALRFYKLRQAGEQASSDYSPKAAEVKANSQAVSVSVTNLTFGLGRHVCPGRFFTVNEIKMILAIVLMNYDITMPEGLTERYENLRFGGAVVPDPRKILRVRKLQE